ncbi:histidine phosphatase family protein [Pseudoroseomonas cervicalis]|uniref:histidine phosphatase family protein n=1 Tax=Teichococcus cervicalis TaxID=204525 RepID=UPI0034A09D7D
MARRDTRPPTIHAPGVALTRRAALLLPALAAARPATATPPLWAALRRGEGCALMRHAIAPGGGDPPGFRPGACETQRNLSAEGRAQAARIGAAFRAEGLGQLPVFTSAWCRCRDTAALLGLGPVQALPALDSFFAGQGDAAASTAALRDWLRERQGAAVLVTHQVNITALTGIFPAPGEVVLVDAAGRALDRQRPG